MTTTSALLQDGFDRVGQTVHGAIDGLSSDTMATQLEPGTNSIAWLVWHLTRVQDDHVAAVAGTEQVWTANGQHERSWRDRFALPFEAAAIGYGFSAEEMALVRDVDADQLAGYYDDVHAATQQFLSTLSDGDLDRVVDENWDPPVTLAVRLVSVLNDDLQHAGQAALIRGVLERR
ncbi:DUF664 domain-containing protein [uncultured Jatrophihabitans sp.]|uniref:mycothiol transferase n=1 Tax=uncultured Jatrophihabitans sp. TaxID=1610747 RepID=UPI0035CC5406